MIDEEYADLISALSLIVGIGYTLTMILPYNISLGLGIAGLLGLMGISYLTMVDDEKKGFSIALMMSVLLTIVILSSFQPVMVDNYNQRMKKACEKVTGENETCITETMGYIRVCEEGHIPMKCSKYSVTSSDSGIAVKAR